MTNIIIALLLQSMNLVHYDIYDCTRPNVYQTHTHIKVNQNNTITTTLNYFPEDNKVADLFFRDGNFDLPFIFAISGNVLASSLLNNIDPQFTKLYIAGLNIAEVFAIASWKKAKSDIKINALIYAQEF